MLWLKKWTLIKSLYSSWYIEWIKLMFRENVLSIPKRNHRINENIIITSNKYNRLKINILSFILNLLCPITSFHLWNNIFYIERITFGTVWIVLASRGPEITWIYWHLVLFIDIIVDTWQLFHYWHNIGFFLFIRSTCKLIDVSNWFSTTNDI